MTGPPAGALTTATPLGPTVVGTPTAPGLPGTAGLAGSFAGAAIGGPADATIGFPGSALTRVPGVGLTGARRGAKAGGLLGPMLAAASAEGVGAAAGAPSASAGAGAGAARAAFPLRGLQLATALRLLLFLSHAASFWLKGSMVSRNTPLSVAATARTCLSSQSLSCILEKSLTARTCSALRLCGLED